MSINQNTPPVNSANALAAYHAAITLWTAEDAKIWEKFTAMVYAHTIVILTIGVLITANEAPKFWYFSKILCGFGIALCILWLIISRRSIHYADNYIYSAREVEYLYLGPEVRVVSNGANLYSEKGTLFQLGPGSGYLYKKDKCLFNYPNWFCIYVVIIIFAAIYCVAFIAA